jgi:GntR family transcriptional regulator/MocR family aminotransferase
MPKQAPDLPLPVLALDPTASAPLHRQIYFAIRSAILDGRLRPGARLPASRRLAADLGVSRNTVTAAFEQLAAEGYIDGRIGAGSFVPPHLPDEAAKAERAAGGGRTGRPETRPAPSRRSAALGALILPAGGRRPFAPGLPELARFPFKEWARLLGRRWRRPEWETLCGDAPGGYHPLRRAIADYLATARAVFCRPEQVIITSGSRQALDLAARVLIDPDDPVWIEEPGYPPTAAVLAAAGARLIPVPVDDEGLSVAAGLALCPQPRLVSIAPSHQYPLGITMSLKRRLALLEQAAAAGSFVLEDDYDSEYRYAGRPLAALQGLDQDGRVIYLGTFSKVMFPSLRLGYMVVPDHLLDSFLRVRRLIDAHPSSIAQPALADFIDEGHLGSHIRRMRGLYQERQAALIDALEVHADGRLRTAPADAGMHLVAALEAGLDDREVAARAAAAGIQAPALSSYYQGPPAESGLLLGYAGVEPGAIRTGVARLAGVIDGIARAGDGISGAAFRGAPAPAASPRPAGAA